MIGYVHVDNELNVVTVVDMRTMVPRTSGLRWFGNTSSNVQAPRPHMAWGWWLTTLRATPVARSIPSPTGSVAGSTTPP